MELNEIVIEGLRGFPALTRIALAPGLTVIHPADDRGAILREVVLDLLYPTSTDLTLQDRIHPSAPQSRIGLLLTGRDGTPYRLMKDVRSGRISLQIIGGDVLSSRGPEIAQVVTAQVGFPQEDVLRDLFFMSRDAMPSQQADALEVGDASLAAQGQTAAKATPFAKNDHGAEPGGFGNDQSKDDGPSGWNKPLPPGFEDSAPGPSSSFAGLSDVEMRTKLEELQKQQSQASSVKELEFELDGLQKKAFELDERLRPLDHLQKQLADANLTLDRVAKAGEVPENLPAQKKEHLQLKANHDAEVKGIDDEVAKIEERLKRELARTASDDGLLRQAMKDPLIAYGLAGGGLCLMLGFIGFLVYQPLRWVALVDVVAFFVALVGTFRFVGDAEQAAKLKGQIRRRQAEREREVNKFELENSHFKALLKRFGLAIEDIDRVEDEVKAFHEARHQKAAAETALSEAMEGASVSDLNQKREAMSESIKQLEEKVYETGGFATNPAELADQIKELSDLLSGPAPTSEAVSEVAPTPAAMIAEDAPATEPPATEPPGTKSSVAGQTAAHLQQLLSLASDLFVCSLEQSCNQVAPRAGQYLTGMSDGRYSEMVFGARGEVSVVDSATRRPIDFGLLTPGDRDIVYVCLKMTIVELACKHSRLPVILDQAFETFPELKHQLIVRMLQFIAQGTQVLVLTRASSIAAAGGHAIALPPPG